MTDWKVVAEDNAQLSDVVDFACPEVEPGKIDFETKSFSEANAHEFSRLSFLTYKTRRHIDAEAKTPGLNVDFIRDAQTDTEVYVLSNKDSVIVDFRGSDPKRIGDVWTDLQLIPMPPWFWGKTHSGFMKAYRRITQPRGANYNDRDLFTVLSENGFDSGLWDLVPAPGMAKPPVGDSNYHAPKKKLFITGNSLGGALALLLAADLTHRELYFRNLLADDDCSKATGSAEMVTGVYAFGTPRVGDPEWATCYDHVLGDRTFRVVSRNDLVAEIPTANYLHVGQHWALDIDGNLAIKASDKKPNSFFTVMLKRVGKLVTGDLVKAIGEHLNYVQPIQHKMNQKCPQFSPWTKK